MIDVRWVVVRWVDVRGVIVQWGERGGDVR